MQGIKWCACRFPDTQSGSVFTAGGVKGHIDYTICGQCDRPIQNSGETSDLSDDRIEPDNDFQFAATLPTFASPIEPWAHGPFHDHTDWLLRKRDKCINDLIALKGLLAQLAGCSYERKAGLKTILRQAAGAFNEVAHIDDLIENINPAFDFSSLTPLPFQPKGGAPQPSVVSRPGYYVEVRHAA